MLDGVTRLIRQPARVVTQSECLSSRAVPVLPDGRRASASHDEMLRLWDLASGKEIRRLEVDAAVLCLAALPDGCLAAGDAIGRLHWLEIIR